MKTKMIIIFILIVICTNIITYSAENVAFIKPVSLKDISTRYNLNLLYTVDSKIVLQNNRNIMEFSHNSRKLLCNGVLLWLNRPLQKVDNNWTIIEFDARTVIAPLMNFNSIFNLPKVETVVIDPGHGGIDSGAIGKRKRIIEKKVNLKIAKRIRKKLKQSGINVKLTRHGDYVLDLSSRTNKANKWEADIFVSIHINSAPNHKAEGFETYLIPAPNVPSTSEGESEVKELEKKYASANTLLAYFIQKEVLDNMHIVDRGIKRARFEVIKNVQCPAVLLECGFISNSLEEDKLSQKKYIYSLADNITRGILVYINKIRIMRLKNVKEK